MTEPEVRRHLNQMLAGLISLDDFEEWLISNTLGVPSVSSDVETRRLVGEILLAHAEYTSDYMTRSELLDRLRAIQSVRRVTFGQAPSRVVHVESSPTLVREWTLQPA